MEENERKVINVFKGAQYVEHIDSQVNNYNYYGQGERENEKKHPLTEEELKAKVARVRKHIGTSNRLWFPVCKYMMWGKMVVEGDFNTAVAKLKELYPELNLNADDMSSLNVLSFRKSLDEWDIENAPVKGATFNKYYTIAELMDL